MAIDSEISRPVRAALVAACILSTASAQGQWVPEASMAVARQETGAARIGDSVYVVGGLLANFPLMATATVERYDIPTGQWSFVAPTPLELHHVGACALDGKLYVIGGFTNGFLARDECWEYDPGTNMWSPIASLPNATGAGWAVAFEGRVYFFGGEGNVGPASSDTWIYDPGANAWTPGADMPTAREHLNAAALGDFIYVVGGRDAGVTPALERYDPAMDSWTVLTPMPTARSAGAVAAFGNDIYVMGGELPMLHAVNEVYDVSSGTWSTRASMAIPRHGIAAVALDDRIFCPAGGIIQGLGPTAQADSFIPDGADAFESFCFGDGGDQMACTPCPCANEALPGTRGGCLNGVSASTVLVPSGVASVTSDTLRFEALGANPSTFGILTSGAARAPANPANPCFGQDSGIQSTALDGLRCVVQGVLRHGARATDASGQIGLFGPGWGAPDGPPGGIIAQGGFGAGSERHFQLIYRELVALQCGTGQNTSNGVTVTFQP